MVPRRPGSAVTTAALLAAVFGVTAVTTLPMAGQGPKGSAVTASTPHLSVQATLSNAETAPGSKISITFDVTPKARMHVYAPGGQYRVVTVKLDPQPLLKVHELVYPKAQTYFFEPLNERALVYSEPFQLVQDLTVGETAEQQAKLRGSRLKLKGVLDYQACDDKFCYLPTTVPFEWSLKITR